jgi:hypothetical protein
MANPEHVAILTQGVEIWNQWRRDHPDEEVDLSEADLRDAKLGGVNLSEAVLTDADLSGSLLVIANLSQANLKRAQFKEASLQGATLCGANLQNADLTSAVLSGTNFSLSGTTAHEYMSVGRPANLRGANLNKAYLSYTNFSDAILDEADLSYTTLFGAIFANTDLSKVKGLDTVDHKGRSTIGIDTIYHSKGKIPEVFLKGAGVQESFLTNMRSLVESMSPIDFYSCFISYSNKDQDFAERLYADLQARGVRCWFAPHDMHIGDKLRPRIDESILLYDKVLLVLTEHSVASQWVEHEVETALGKELGGKLNVLFPIRLDETVLQSKTGWASHVRLTRHIGDFTQWKSHDDYQKAFERLLRDLKAGA